MDLQHLFASTKENIVSKLMLNLNDYISEMEKLWDEDCATIENRVGFGKLLKLFGAGAIGLFNKEKKQEIQDSVIQPLTDEIADMFEEKLNAWGNRGPTLVDADMKYLDSSLNGIMDTVSIKLDDATRLFLGEKVQVKGEVGGGNGLQLLLAAIQGNINDIVYISGGKLNWKEFITTYVVLGVLQVLIFSVIGGPVGIAAFILMELIQTAFRANKMNSNILRNMKDKLFTLLRDGTREGLAKIFDALSKNFDPVRVSSIATITAKRDEVKKLQEKILADRTKSESEFANEKQTSTERLRLWETLL
ncbi:MAG: hypothetical protein LBU32_23495 [Clostridiales bacterium]|nr:hypothetical protein [Clostridiales bacterium]